MTQPTAYTFQKKSPRIDPGAYVSPGAFLIGDVTLADKASVWFNAVLRADLAEIVIGEGSNVQDLTMIHVDGKDERGPGTPPLGTHIGRHVTIGHNCVVHSVTIEDDCLIGMHATLMSGVTIGRGSIIGAGAVVLENTAIPPFSLVVGNPGQIKKTYQPDIIERVIRRAADAYTEKLIAFKDSFHPSAGM